MSGDVSAAGGGLGRSAETVRTPSFSASAGQSSVKLNPHPSGVNPTSSRKKVDVIVVDEGKIIAETALVVQSRRRAAARSEI